MRPYVKGLLRRFRELDALYVRQAALLAELKAELRGGGEGLACRMAYCELLNEERAERRHRARFPFLDPEVPLAGEDRGFREMVDSDEWRWALTLLSWPARKLARIAEQEARAFIPSDESPWYGPDIMRLRARVRERFIAWSREHSEAAYLRARREICDMLRALERR